MGKRIISQRRGTGSPRYKAPKHKFRGFIKYPGQRNTTMNGCVLDIIRTPAHSAPMALVEYNLSEELATRVLVPATEGMKVGEEIICGNDAKIVPGNTTSLEMIPEGVAIFNIEGTPGDGGKFARASGNSARIISKSKDKVIVMLPSKKQKTFNPKCRATLGIIAGGGRTDKPIVKAGNKFYKMRAKNKLWPITSGSAMNAVDHPLGNKRSSRKSKAKPAPRNAPPGRKVGLIRPRRTGKK